MIDIDTPEFDRELAHSRDGRFQEAAQGRIEAALQDLQAQLRQGLSPEDFSRARDVEAALSTASDVLRFSLSSNPT